MRTRPGTSPRRCPGVEQVADVRAGRDPQRVGVLGAGVAVVGAVVVRRVEVAVDGAEAVVVERAHRTRVRHDLIDVGRADGIAGAGVARDEVECARRRRPELGVVVVVAHRVVLRVIPQAGDRVAVEVVHHQARP